MAFELPYTALVTVDDLVSEAIGSVDLKTDDPLFERYAARAIAATTDLIETRLRRTFMVRSKAARLNRGRWRYNATYQKYAAFAPYWPVVQVSTTGVTIGDAEDREGGLLLNGSPADMVIECHAGYRRHGQALPVLQQKLPDLTVLPPELPAQIHGAAIDIALHLIAARAKGPGESTRTLDPGGATISVTRSDHRYVDTVIEGLSMLQGALV